MRYRSKCLLVTFAVGLGSTLALLCLVGHTRPAHADPGTRYVAPDGGDGSQCDTIATRCRTVQRAIDVADDFDEIWVTTGTYTDATGTVATITKTIVLLGGWDDGFTTRDLNTYPTTLDARRSGRVVHISGAVSPTIDGFIIIGGNANNEPSFARRGGGIGSVSASPIIQNNVITNNIACTDTTSFGFGGGIYLSDASVSTVISGNRVLSNTASTRCSGFGGGMSLFDSAGGIVIVGNEIHHNIGGRGGGGVYLNECYDITFDGNWIVSNTATLSSTISGRGGGFYLEYVAPFTLTNNVIAQNHANAGGGIYIYGHGSYYATGTLVNNTIVRNNVGPGGEGLWAISDVTVTLSNNIIVSHTYGIYSQGSAVVTATHTLFHDSTSGNTGGTGSITSTNEITGSNPLFVDPVGWDYHIRASSPAIDTGATLLWLITDIDGDARPLPVGGNYDIGADEANWWQIYLPLVLRSSG
jgi:hypothetical protein